LDNLFLRKLPDFDRSALHLQQFAIKPPLIPPMVFNFQNQKLNATMVPDQHS